MRGHGDVASEWALVDPEDEARVVWLGGWSLNGKGYAHLSRPLVPGDRGLSMHRVLFGCARGDGLLVDHINGDPLDNRKANLRLVSRSENAQNRRPTVDRGVSRCSDGRGWLARVTVGGGTRGKRCATKDEAREVARQMRADLMTHHREIA